jgi:hypothetical protein
MRFRQPRQHDEAHLEFIRQLPCVICFNDIETQAAHLRSENLRYGKRHTGMAEKPSDRWALPLCGRCHTAQHKSNEKNFWLNSGIDPWVLAMSLYGCTGDIEMAHTVIENQVRAHV